MSYRDDHGTEREPGGSNNLLIEFQDRYATDQAIDRIYAAAVKQTGTNAFLNALAELVAADDVVLECEPCPDTASRSSQTPRILSIELPKSNTGVRAVVFRRDERSQEFGSKQAEWLMRLAPHIARAISIRGMLQYSVPNDPRKEIDQETLQRLFRLAPSHARLLALLVGGDQIKSAAAKLGVTEGSARQYLKKIFEKTGARRQMDLIRLADRALSQHEA